MKKKKIIILIIIILIIIILVSVYFLVFKKNNKLEVLSNIMYPSYSAYYQDDILTDMLDELQKKGTLENYKATSKNYKDCSLELNKNNTNYKLTPVCKDWQRGTNEFDSNYTIIKADNISEVYDIVEVSSGYLFVGKYKNSNKGVIGLIDFDGNLIGKKDIELENNNTLMSILGLNEVSGNYVVSYRETTENEEIESLLTHPIKLVSVDSKFENIKTNQFECKYPIMSLISDEKDTLVFNLVDKLLFVDKNLNMSEKKGIDGTNILSYQNNKLYYIVDKNHIGILDYKTNKTSKFKIDFNMFNTKIDFLDLQILGDKLFVITFDEIRVYDDSGNLVKKYSYDNLNVSFDSDNNDEATPVNYMIIDKVDNQLHIQTILNGYLMTEKYDTNGELIYRKVFGQNYNDYGVTNRDDTYMMGNNHMTNIQFSDKYEVFIKRDMLQE